MSLTLTTTDEKGRKVLITLIDPKFTFIEGIKVSDLINGYTHWLLSSESRELGKNWLLKKS